MELRGLIYCACTLIASRELMHMRTSIGSACKVMLSKHANGGAEQNSFRTCLAKLLTGASMLMLLLAQQRPPRVITLNMANMRATPQHDKQHGASEQGVSAVPCNNSRKARVTVPVGSECIAPPCMPGHTGVHPANAAHMVPPELGPTAGTWCPDGWQMRLPSASSCFLFLLTL